MAFRNFKTLIPIEYLKISDNLKNSIQKYGVLNPIIINEKIIIDGIKRYFISKKLKIKLNFKEIDGNPYINRLNFNIERNWTLPEIALTFINLNENFKKEFLKRFGIPSYPEISKIFNLLLSSKKLIKLSLEKKIDLSTLNNLILWEKNLKIIKGYANLKGTFSELKNVSILLRKAKIEGIEEIKFKKNAKEMEKYSKKILYKNYFRDLKRLENKLKHLKIPKEVKISFPEYFEEKNLKFEIEFNDKNFDNISNWLFENFENIKNILKEIK